jgi:cytochrome P450
MSVKGSSAMTAAEVDFSDPEVQRCPFDAYRALRGDHPVYLDPRTGIYQVNDYALVRQAAMNTAAVSSRTGTLLRGTALPDPYGARIRHIFATEGLPPIEALIASDPPQHRRQRALVEKAFTQPRVREMECYLEELIADLIDGFEDGEEIEFVSRFALMVPMSVIADQLGLPRGDSSSIKRWSDAAIASLNPAISPDEQIELAHVLCEMHRYLIAKAEEYRAQPAACMLSDLVHAEVEGSTLELPELVAIVQQLLVAGNETTTSALAEGMLRLIEEPDLQRRLREQPALVDNFAEEVLRTASPLQGLFRKATQDMCLGGVEIPAGSLMLLRWGAANRDPAQFERPDEFVVDREDARRHVAFGVGAHHCIGNQLARAELRISFRQLVERRRNFSFARGADSVRRSPSYIAYGARQVFIRSDAV